MACSGLELFTADDVTFITTINVKKTKFIKTVIGDVVAHLKPQKFTVSSDL